MQDRERESRGLAGTCLCNTDHVAAGQRDRNRLGLDGSRRDVLLVGKCARDGPGETEILE